MSSAGASAQQEMRVVRDETPHTLVMSCVYIGCQVKVIVGEDRDLTGQLLSIDGPEGVVKLDRGNLNMFQMGCLCKVPRD